MDEILALYKSSEANLSAPVLVDLIKRALDARGVFNFADLLGPVNAKLQTDKSLAEDPQVSQWHAALEVFAHGTWEQYGALGQDVAPLSDSQARKLKILSLVTMCRTVRVAGYDDIKKALGLSSDAEVEHVIMEGVSSGVVSGQIHASKRQVDLSARIGRDVDRQRLDELQQILTQQLAHIDSVVACTRDIADESVSAGVSRGKQVAEFASVVSAIQNSM